MNRSVKLVAFAFVVAAAFGVGFGVGELAGPFDGGAEVEAPVTHEEVHP